MTAGSLAAEALDADPAGIRLEHSLIGLAVHEVKW